MLHAKETGIEVLLLLPGWDASPLKGYIASPRSSPQYVTGTHLYTWIERDKGE